MNSQHRRRYILLFLAATVIAVSIFLYKVRPLAGIAFGSTAIAVAVLAHLGVLAAIGASVVALRRHRSGKPIEGVIATGGIALHHAGPQTHRECRVPPDRTTRRE